MVSKFKLCIFQQVQADGLIPGQTYTVALHFVELDGLRSRIFTVVVNGMEALSDFDIMERTGQRQSWLTNMFLESHCLSVGRYTADLLTCRAALLVQRNSRSCLQAALQLQLDWYNDSIIDIPDLEPLHYHLHALLQVQSASH